MTEHGEILTTGGKAPAGKYYCDKCGFEYEHKDENEPLPNCQAEGIYTVWNRERMKPRFTESI